MVSPDLPSFHTAMSLIKTLELQAFHLQISTMSDHLPFEMQEKIMKRLPVKSLIQFRSVSKAWKSLIDSPQFISAHSVYHSHTHRLLVGYQKQYNNDTTYVSILDDDTFPREKLHLTVPLPVKRLNGLKVVGSCHGLFCLSGFYVNPHDTLDDYEIWYVAVLWNPSIRKAIAIDLPNSILFHEAVFGFWVCSVTRDPKILLASFCISSEFIFRNDISGQLKIFTLSSGAWQSIDITLPFELSKWSSQSVVDGFIYLLVSNTISVEGVDRTCSLIYLFDLATDELKEVHLPEILALKPAVNLSVNKLRDSLAVIDFCLDNQCVDVWMMEDGVPNLFTKFYTFKLPAEHINVVLGFKKNGEPVLEMQASIHGQRDQATLGFYNPVSKHIHHSSIFGIERTFSAYSYTETLLLLNQKQFSCYGIDMYENDDSEVSNMDSLSLE